MTEDKIYITRSHIIPEAIAYLDGIYDIEVWQQNSPPPRDLLLEKAQECDALLTEVTDIVDAELLDQATNLKVVANRAVGLGQHRHSRRHSKRHPHRQHSPACCTSPAPTSHSGLILALARNIAYGERRIRAGEWKVFDQIPYLGTDVHGATLGIIGMGLIGTAVARRARGIRYANRLSLPHAQARCRGRAWRGVARQHGHRAGPRPIMSACTCRSRLKPST